MSKGMALAFFLLPSLGDLGVFPALAIITVGYGMTGRIITKLMTHHTVKNRCSIVSGQEC